MKQKSDTAERDAATLRVLGFFFTIIASLVLIGTYWAVGDFRGMVVSICSGLVLLAVGTGMIWVSKRIS